MKKFITLQNPFLVIIICLLLFSFSYSVDNVVKIISLKIERPSSVMVKSFSTISEADNNPTASERQFQQKMANWIKDCYKKGYVLDKTISSGHGHVVTVIMIKY